MIQVYRDLTLERFPFQDEKYLSIDEYKLILASREACELERPLTLSKSTAQSNDLASLLSFIGDSGR